MEGGGKYTQYVKAACELMGHDVGPPRPPLACPTMPKWKCCVLYSRHGTDRAARRDSLDGLGPIGPRGRISPISPLSPIRHQVGSACVRSRLVWSGAGCSKAAMWRPRPLKGQQASTWDRVRWQPHRTARRCMSRVRMPARCCGCHCPQGEVVRRVRVPHRPTGLVCTPDGTQLIVTCAAPKKCDRVPGCAVRRDLAHDRRRTHRVRSGAGPSAARSSTSAIVSHNDVSVMDLCDRRPS